ncbi:Uncharacterised protein [Aeromonas encheleia]|uniref:hypothetical protein n=1 Tax=Aeromonas encheleia TaxID=73010 RepID=UPI0005B20F81|nr:hypothetical protein [Aeromonas encheleia]VEG97994.1 Uncharacterised protein [Aeromonas encheleia]
MHATGNTISRLTGAALAMAAVFLSGAAMAANTGQHGEDQVQCSMASSCKGQSACEDQSVRSMTREECNSKGGKVR